MLILHAQDYLINFSGTGSSTTVETITVENLTQGKSITFSGSKSLHLMSVVTGNTPLLEYMDYPMIVYPNPSAGDFTVQFDAQKSGMVTVAIYDLIGREVSQLRQNVQGGFQSFKVAGIGNGVYSIHVLLEDQKFTQKVVCNGKLNSNVSISYNGFSEAKQKDATLKSATSEQAWQYNTGDRLKFQGTSGKYSTIVMDVPTQSKTLSFDFVECTDADGNNYPVVKIGNQLWMAENLKTTKYNDGTNIPNVTDNLQWANLTSDSYCWYDNNIDNKGTFGALYNGFAIRTNKLAPRGWHVAKLEEWEDLITFAGGNKEVRFKLRETGFTHWKNSPITGTNEYGFSSLPGGLRLSYQPGLLDKDVGNFGNLFNQAMWWTGTEANSDHTSYFWISDNETDLPRYGNHLSVGSSVRCVLGSKPFLNTTTISRIAYSSAESGGEILNYGGLPITSCGICWSRNPNPTISDNVSIGSLIGGKFKSILSNLYFGTKYYVRTYAINDYGVGYGNELSFETPGISASIASINVKFDSDSIQMGSVGFARCWALDQNGDTIPNIPVQWTTSHKKIADINSDGKINTDYDGEVYIKARYNNHVDSAKFVVTPDFNNWKTFFEPIPNAFPDLNSYFKEVGGNTFLTVLARVDLNKDGRTDLVFHLYHFRSVSDNLTIPLDAPVQNRLVSLVSQPDGTLKDQTAELFGTSNVDLAGGCSRKVRIADLNSDGYPDWVYSLNREDGRPGGDQSNFNVAVLSNGDGTYQTVAFGDKTYHHSVEIYRTLGGQFRILLDGNEEYSFSNGKFIKEQSLPTRAGGTYLAFSSTKNNYSDYLLTDKIDGNWTNPNYLVLYNGNQSWSQESYFKWPSYRLIDYIDWTGVTTKNNAISYNGKEFVAGGFFESVALKLYPNSSPTPIAHFATTYIPEGTQGRTMINSNEAEAWSKLMAFESKNGLLQELNIISEPEGSYNINFMDAMDVNKDGYDDLITYPYIDGAKPRVYLNNQAGKLILLNQNRFPDTNVNGNYNSAFVDIDGDGIDDLVFFPGNGCFCDNPCTTFLLYKGRRNLK